MKQDDHAANDRVFDPLFVVVHRYTMSVTLVVIAVTLVVIGWVLTL